MDRQTEDDEPAATRPSRRRFLATAAGTGVALAAGLARPSLALAEPRDDQYEWVANHLETRLMGADGQPVAWLPKWTRLRIVRGLPNGWLEVWSPRLALVGRVPVSTIGRIGTPTAAQLAQEQAEPFGPDQVASIGLPARVVGAGNLRLWPAPRPDTLLRQLGHNASIWALTSVEGEDGEEWYQVSPLNPTTNALAGMGYLHNSVVRLPRLPGQNGLPANPDRAEAAEWHFQADLKEPAMLTAFQGSAAVWSSLTLKGRAASGTTIGDHRIVSQVANETMNSETLIPPVPRNAPGGYYLKNVLYTQYFRWDGQSIHYNYWSSNWGYPGSNGCLGLPLAEAKWAWDFAEIGTRVKVFA